MNCFEGSQHTYQSQQITTGVGGKEQTDVKGWRNEGAVLSKAVGDHAMEVAVSKQLKSQ